MSEQWLSIIEYARKFNISDMTVRRRIKTGKLQAVLREGKYYIPFGSIDEGHRPSHRVSPPPPPIVKSVPAAHTPIPEPPMRYEPAPRNQGTPHFVPHHISRELREPNASSRTMIDGNTLLAFCEGALKKLSDAEIRMEQQYQQKIAQLEAQVQAKQTEINQLFQQVEDLQVLVKILERKAGKIS